MCIILNHTCGLLAQTLSSVQYKLSSAGMHGRSRGGRGGGGPVPFLHGGIPEDGMRARDSRDKTMRSIFGMGICTCNYYNL